MMIQGLGLNRNNALRHPMLDNATGHWSKRKLTVQPRWAKKQTVKFRLRPTNE